MLIVPRKESLTFRVDADTKRDFLEFCNNAGISSASAFSLFMKTTLRLRRLPFAVSDTVRDADSGDQDAG